MKVGFTKYCYLASMFGEPCLTLNFPFLSSFFKVWRKSIIMFVIMLHATLYLLPKIHKCRNPDILYPWSKIVMNNSWWFIVQQQQFHVVPGEWLVYFCFSCLLVTCESNNCVVVHCLWCDIQVTVASVCRTSSFLFPSLLNYYY